MTSFGPTLDAEGWLRGAVVVPSPNCDDRPAGSDVSLLIIHGISLPPDHFSGTAVRRLFTNTLNFDDHPYFQSLQGLRVSSHFFLRRNGELLQFVSTHRRAWHAGASVWQGRERCNDFSIGIEVEGSDHQPYARIQYIRLARLIRILRHHYRIADIVGHADVAPGRKTDPGPFFDWDRLNSLLRR